MSGEARSNCTLLVNTLYVSKDDTAHLDNRLLSDLCDIKGVFRAG